MNKNEEKNREVIERWLDENKEKRIIIAGDFNARTGDRGGIWNEEGERIARKNRDEVINGEEKETLRWMDERGTGIVNGSTKRDVE